MSIRRYLIFSNRRPAMLVRRIYRWIIGVSVPSPRFIIKPALVVFHCLRATYFFFCRVFICEPLFKAYCTSHGKNLHTGAFVHWIQGNGDLFVGDDVRIDGKCSIAFATRYSERPTLVIGSNTFIGHGCTFIVGRSISVGQNCLLASNVRIADSPGHATDPDSRLQGLPAPLENVRPVIIGDNVWLGFGAIVFPGVSIGEGSVVGTASVVTKNVPAFTLVAGNPARPIRSLLKPISFCNGASCTTSTTMPEVLN